MALPIQITNILDLSLMQKTWSAQLNPVLANEIIQGNLLSSVALISGANVINHNLGQKLKSYFVRKRQWLSSGTPTAYDIYDTQISNVIPQLTLNLTCTQGTTVNPVLVDIWVF